MDEKILRSPDNREDPPDLGNMTPEVFLKRFPDQLRGASVERYLVPNAKHCLVHIRQWHFDPRDSGADLRKKAEGNDELVSQIIRIQTDIHLILLQLRQKYGAFDLHQEGIEAETQSASISLQMRALEKQSSRGGKTKDEEWNLLRMQLAPGYMAYRNQLNIRPTEDPALIKKIVDLNEEIADLERDAVKARGMEGKGLLLQKEKKLGERENAVMTEREDRVLSMLSEKKQKSAIMTFGSDHDWKDNVEKWNTLHPQNAFSLIVITPKNLQSDEEIAKMKE